MTLETEEQKIERRSRSADAAFLGLLRLWDLHEWFWIVLGVLLLFALLVAWLLG